MTVSTPWLICPKPNPQARLRLFCFPYAGAGASIFLTWPNLLPSNIEVYSVQLPGRENRVRESPFTHLEPLIQTVSQVLLPYLDRPFAFFGHSLGALISFELTRQLRSQKYPRPLQLFVSGRRAPTIITPNSSIFQLSDSALIEKLYRYNGTPEEVLRNPELIQLLLPVLRADFAIHETYVYTPTTPLDCPIAAFGGLQDREVSRDDLSAWRDQTYSTFTLKMFPGDHFFLKTEPDQVLQAISQTMSRIIEYAGC